MKMIALSILVSILLFLTRVSAQGVAEFEHAEVHEKATNHWAVELAPLADPNEVARAHGFINMGQVANLENVYLFHEEADDRHTRSEVPHISTSPHVSWHENQVAKKRFARQEGILSAPFKGFTDPSFNLQWHLKATVANGVDINVFPVWATGNLGDNVTIAIVDDGLEAINPDLAQNFNAEASWDFNDNRANPLPGSGDDHGTSCGGAAAGRNDNGVCGSGSAPHARVSGIRLISGYVSDATEASALTYKNQINDIYSNSWGPTDDGRRLEGPGKLLLAAWNNAVQTGRQGLGSIYVWAGGNGYDNDNCNYDGYANSRFVITIGAVDYLGNRADYSERCSKLLAVAPSSGRGKSITTSDLVGPAGRSNGDCMNSFTGTSAAAPIAAGVVALILAANPQLGWRDVQDVIVRSSKVVHPEDPDWYQNGAGLSHSHKYGFGLIDAEAAMKRAIAHQNLPEYKSVVSVMQEVNEKLGDSSPVQSTIAITDDIVVETVEVYVNATHTNLRGSLAITLIAPSGTKSLLQLPHTDNGKVISWTYTTVRSWGESSKGQWTLKIEDKVANAGTGYWNSWQVKVYGH